MTTQNTPTPREAIRSLIDRQDRGRQTALVGEVISYDRATQTAKLKPQHREVFGPTEATQELPDIDNVPVMFPGAAGYSITWDLSPGDFVMVLCTKYSLDVWRQRAELSDPGDSRKFGLSGATCYPVRINPDGGETEEVADDGMVIAAPKIYLTSKDAADAMALASLVKSQLDDLAADMTTLNTKYDAHGHGGMGASPPSNIPLGMGFTSASDVDSKKVLGD